MYKQWIEVDERTGEACQHLPGMRVLRQDPVECLFSFICSSNNNITRITQNVNSLRQEYGRPIAVLSTVSLSLNTGNDAATFSSTPVTVDGETVSWFDFPSVETLAHAQEDRLRELGLGYRARYIGETCRILQSKPNGALLWLHALRGFSREDTQKELLSLVGVGPKVADCVALFSLDKTDCIPVDTHVFEIACRDYDASLGEAKSMTPKVYDRIGALFRGRFGSHAGWAHCVLFAAELPVFLSFMPEHVREQWAAERKVKRERKAAANAARAARVLLAKSEEEGKGKQKKKKKSTSTNKTSKQKASSSGDNSRRKQTHANDSTTMKQAQDAAINGPTQQREGAKNHKKRKYPAAAAAAAVEIAVGTIFNGGANMKAANVGHPVKVETEIANGGRAPENLTSDGQALAGQDFSSNARQARATRRSKVKQESYY
jgi:N-glycosylase/DNA lyase